AVMTDLRIWMLLLPAVLLSLPGAAAAGDPPAGTPPVDYLRDVKPLLAKNCFQCHGVKAHKGGLRVDTLQALLAGGDTGPAIVPGKSGESLLVAAVSGVEGVNRMPLKKPPLSAAQIATLKAWIDAGAATPAG